MMVKEFKSTNDISIKDIKKEGNVITARIKTSGNNELLDKLLHQEQSFSIACRGYKDKKGSVVPLSFDLVNKP